MERTIIQVKPGQVLVWNYKIHRILHIWHEKGQIHRPLWLSLGSVGVSFCTISRVRVLFAHCKGA